LAKFFQKMQEICPSNDKKAPFSLTKVPRAPAFSLQKTGKSLVFVHIAQESGVKTG
jgi:hypothetical protein